MGICMLSGASPPGAWRALAGWDLARAVGALHGAIRAVLATPGAPVTQG